MGERKSLSGDGDSGGQFNFRLNVLAGDSSGDGYVLINDLVPIYTQLGIAPDPTEQFLDTNGGWAAFRNRPRVDLSKAGARSSRAAIVPRLLRMMSLALP